MRHFQCSIVTANESINAYRDRGGNIAYNRQLGVFYRPNFPHTIDLEVLRMVGDYIEVTTDTTQQEN
jgi:hypothetical protein